MGLVPETPPLHLYGADFPLDCIWIACSGRGDRGPGWFKPLNQLSKRGRRGVLPLPRGSGCAKLEGWVIAAIQRW